MTPPHASAERGFTLIELMIALIVLSLGVLALGHLFPQGEQSQLKDRMIATANYYAQEQIENLQGVAWSDPQLTDGTHPAVGSDSLGTYRQWTRNYVVTTMAAPLNNLKRVTVTVNWKFPSARSVTAVTYLRR